MTLNSHGICFSVGLEGFAMIWYPYSGNLKADKKEFVAMRHPHICNFNVSYEGAMAMRLRLHGGNLNNSRE